MANPRFELSDFLCEHADLVHDFNDGWDLAFHSADEPERPLSKYQKKDSVPMLLFRRTVKVGTKFVVLPALAFPFVQAISVNPSLKTHTKSSKITDKFKIMLRIIKVRGFLQLDLLCEMPVV